MPSQCSWNVLSVASTLIALTTSVDAASCCWSKWGDKTTCGDYPADGKGGLCSTDWSRSCSNVLQCPTIPAPTPPTPPTPSPPRPAPSMFNGLCYASWATEGEASYDSISSDASIGLATVTGINTLAITNTYYQDDQNSTTIKFSPQKSQTDNAILRAVRAARARGLRVAIKPHVDFLADPSHWRGEIGPAFSESQWDLWFASYSTFMLHHASIAKEVDADLFIVGTELITTEGASNEARWRKLISRLRNTTGSGIPFVYAANWDPGPANVRFWDIMDFVGVDAYYPLAAKTGSTLSQLISGWQTSPVSHNITDTLIQLHLQTGKPILFTEIGYTTTDACAVGNHAGGNPSMQAQALAYEAFFSIIYPQPWFAGVFFWDWETSTHQGGRCDNGAFSFTPSNKTAATIMRRYFGDPPPPQPPTPPPACPDVPPAPGTYSCAQQKSWGKCDVAANPWMAGYCCKTCFDCDQNCGRQPMLAPSCGSPCSSNYQCDFSCPVCHSQPGRTSFCAGYNSTTVVAPTVVYSNGLLSSGWQDWSYNGNTNLRDASQTYGGHTASAHGSYNNWGAMSFKHNSDFSTASFSSVRFAIHSSQLSLNQVQIAAYGTKDQKNPFPALFVNHYTSDCSLPVDGWVQVTLPVADFFPPDFSNHDLTRLEIKGNYATGVGEFWLDQLQFF